MYRKEEQAQISSKNFELPFEGKLSEDNRWVIMASLIPWSEFEEEYASIFDEEMGAPAKSFRMALGALIIKEKLGISDRETVEQIKENPYLQYFIGLSSYNDKTPFDSSMLVHFRQRIGVELVNKINQEMVKKMLEETSSQSNQKKRLKNSINRGKLILGRGIRISGPPLGRPSKNISKEKKKQATLDEKIRSSIEGKFGQGKRRFSLNCVMAKLSHTSKTAIAITFLVMNLSSYLSRLLRDFVCLFFNNLSFLWSNINKNYVLLIFVNKNLFLALP